MKVAKIIGNVILWVFVGLAAFLTIMVFIANANSNGVPALFGTIPVVVESDSMVPTFKTGDLIFDKELTDVEKRNLKEGDVITFYADLNDDQVDELNTHRIQSVRQVGDLAFYTTKGDNVATNPVDDPNEVRHDLVVGQYTGTAIGGVGGVIGFLQTPNGFLICIVLPLIAFFIFELYNFIMAIVVRKNRKSQAAMSAEQEEEIRKRAIEEYQKQLQMQGAGSNETAQDDKTQTPQE